MKIKIPENVYGDVDDFIHFPIQKLFLENFGRLPSIIAISHVDTTYIFNKYSKNIINQYNYDGNIICAFMVIDENGIYAYLSATAIAPEATISFFYLPEFKKEVEEHYNNALKNKIKSVKNTINVLCQNKSGFYLENFKIPSKDDLDINIHYNDDFIKINNLIVNNLNHKNNKGLVLLHGIPGTGKTTYIRYLLSKINKRIIFIPPSIIDNLSNPSMLTAFIEWPNSVLIIEDAENAISKRSSGGSSAVSNILNICDGILGDILNTHVIATFNIEIDKIDSALLRKGRLLARYEFTALKKDKAIILAKNIGLDESKINGDMILSDIYNASDKDFSNQGKINKLGFSIPKDKR